MIENQEQLDAYKAAVRPPHKLHLGYRPRPGGERSVCGQQYADLTTVRDFVNCRKCLHIMGVRPIRRKGIPWGPGVVR